MKMKIIKVRAVGLCSKHRKKNDEILKYKNGTPIKDKDIACITEMFDKK